MCALSSPNSTLASPQYYTPVPTPSPQHYTPVPTPSPQQHTPALTSSPQHHRPFMQQEQDITSPNNTDKAAMFFSNFTAEFE